MKTIEVDDDLYRYIASQTQHIGESASDILRRLLLSDSAPQPTQAAPTTPSRSSGIVVSKDAGRSASVDRVKAMRTLLISDEFAAQERAIGRFMLILTTLYRVDQQGFADGMALKGRTRLYFADNPQTLLESGKTTKPKQIPETPFWVITNTNTGRKRQMVEQLMEKMQFPSDLTEKVVNAI
ncbi:MULTISPECIES: replication initiation negative regulator SeqA [Salinivibrio]|uniref:Negative modulator of initiation of replication n=1 Tax=Salinivibrio kushneri TaxID=1908198 RepID=A0AB36KBN6_9GAMM|nr:MULTISPECIES: replication initiation negative regulator SeqA [Salinivibrio]OOE35905.1 replication initiation regulator SeqA [Salinivibrio kushneri]OOE36482.1 replication initiation regulator SeqA [Salinivibrio kushneri]OOE41136.1 replication initiation regulator SeqA [Salinivibrio kushneri]OOE43607.1 replication initiation regulator SeqA [Salinivibrio kushneri]OOE46082.1 replication initiation regulator SeqA [Salinivibrio kushneri]